MGRGTVESGLFRSERYGLEVRTTDPATYSEGEAWIRSDVAPDTDQIATLRFANGGGTIDIPIYAAGTAGQNVSEAVAVQVGGQQGYIPIASDGATYSQLRAQHAGSQYQFHDAKSAVGLSAIPASAIEQFHAQRAFSSSDDGTTISTWSGETGSFDATGGFPTVVGNGINGYRSVDFDGTDDVLRPGYTIDTTQDRTVFVVATLPSGSETAYGMVDTNAGDRIQVAETSGSNFIAGYGDTFEETAASTNDPAVFTLRASSGNGELWINGTSIMTFTYSGVGSGVTNTIGARNRPENNSEDQYFPGQVGQVEPHNTALSDSDRSDREQEIASDWDITL